MHGYGTVRDIHDKKSLKVGLFESGIHKTESEIRTYDYDIDYIAQAIPMKTYIEF